MSGEATADDAIAPFVQHVAEQIARRPHAASADARESVAVMVRGMLGEIGLAFMPANVVERDRRESAAHIVCADPALLAAFFQNLDVLYANSAPCADAASAVLMRAMELSRAELDTSA